MLDTRINILSQDRDWQLGDTLDVNSFFIKDGAQIESFLEFFLTNYTNSSTPLQ